ncbi:MAG TPA: DUF551 domain-containing protein [Buchnera sp. (in: enterobacteria)]|nr:DUF551 domain-containing protein [Buchnera sp. (in: enterobacteria)]
MTNWISVKDKLPGNNRYVITVCGNDIYRCGWFNVKLNAWFTFPEGSDSTDYVPIDVEYWMEIPKHPEKDY